MKISRCSYNESPFRGIRHRQTEYSYARTGQPTVFLRCYRPQLGNPAKHRDAQSRHTPARQRANALRVLRPTALLAPCRISTPAPRCRNVAVGQLLSDIAILAYPTSPQGKALAWHRERQRLRYSSCRHLGCRERRRAPGASASRVGSEIMERSFSASA
jgi:hypothetical protein